MAICKVKTGSTSLVIWLALAVLTAGYAWAQAPSATVDFEEESLRLIIGGERGSGTLHFQGSDYTFKLNGITAGGVGYSDVNAQGDVYGLNEAGDFAGTYVEGTAGMTVQQGSGGIWMSNDKGVTLHLKTSTEGLQLSLGAGGVIIEMTE